MPIKIMRKTLTNVMKSIVAVFAVVAAVILGGGSAKAAESDVTACGYQVVLNGRFEVRYFMKLSEAAKNDAGAYMSFNINGKTSVGTMTEYTGDYVIFSCLVDADDVATPIEAVYHSGGKYYSLEEISIRDYLETIIENKDNKSDYAVAKNISLAILEYAARAQVYFDYRTDDLADKNYQVNNYLNVKDSDIVDNKTHDLNSSSNEDFLFLGNSLILDSDISIVTYFSCVRGYSQETIEQKYDIFVPSMGDKKLSYIYSKDTNILKIVLSGIPMAEIDDSYMFFLNNKSDSKKSIMIESSVLNYMSLAVKTDNVKLKDLCKSMYLYNKAAKDYFEKYTLIISTDKFENKGLIGCNYDSNGYIAAGENGGYVVFSDYTGNLRFECSNDNVIISNIDGSSYSVKAKDAGITEVRVTDDAGKQCNFTVKAYSASIKVDCAFEEYNTIRSKVGDKIKFTAQVIAPDRSLADYEYIISNNRAIEVDKQGNATMVGMGYANVSIRFYLGNSRFDTMGYSCYVSSADGIYCSSSLVTVSDAQPEELVEFTGCTGQLTFESDSDCVDIDYVNTTAGMCMRVAYVKTGVANVKVIDSAGKTAYIKIVACTIAAITEGCENGVDIYWHVGDVVTVKVDANDPSGLLTPYIEIGNWMILNVLPGGDDSIATIKVMEAGETFITVFIGDEARIYNVHISE